MALLGYVATERRPHAREYLAALFWPDDPSARGRSNLRRELYNRVLCAVAANQPLLLLLDDIQWMDAASIGLLFHLVRRIAKEPSRILILCAYRPQEIIRGRSGTERLLASALSEFPRTFGDVWLSLGWADEVELLRAMRERRDLVRDGDGIWRQGPDLDWQLMPARIEAVIEARIQGLKPDYKALLSIASVEGEQFTAQVLARVQDLAEGPLLRLLVQELGNNHRLIHEQDAYQTNCRTGLGHG